MTPKQKEFVAIAFAESASAEQFDKKVELLGLSGYKYEKEIADLIYAIATNKPVPKSNG
jgi:hypothetical protein